MARLFDDGSSEYLEIDSTPVTAVPLTMACWFYTDDDGNSGVPLGIYNSGSNGNLHQIYVRSSGNELWAMSTTSSPGSAVATASYTQDTWHHACAVFATTTSRSMYLDGANKGTNTTSKAPTGINRISIGRSGDLSPSFYLSGRVAEAAIWNVALTDAEAVILAAGFSPLFVRPQYLIAYWPLIRDEDQDRVGGYDLTAYNTPSFVAHPPVRSFAAQSVVNVAEAAPPGVVVPVLYYHYAHH